MMKKIKAKLKGPGIRNALRTSKGILTTVLSAAEVAVDGLPIPGLKAAVGGVSLIIDGIDKTSQNTETLNGIHDHLVHLVDEVLAPLTSVPESKVPEALRAAIDRLTSDLNGIALEWKEASSRGRVARVFQREDDVGDLQRLSDNIHRAVEAFMAGANVRTELAVLQTKAIAVQLQEDRKRNAERTHSSERKKLVTSMRHAKAASYRSGRKDAPEQCFEGTRTEILLDIKAWLNNRAADAPPFFWLNGIAGIGKSTIAQTIAAQAGRDQQLGASFFCSRREDDLRNSALIFPTIAYQLAQFNNEFKKRLADVLESDSSSEIPPETFQSQLEKLILEPLSHVTITEPIFVVLDAFDECDASGAKEILRLLLAASARLGPLFPFKIFVASRPEPQIRSVLKHSDRVQTVILHDIERSVVQRDIGTYLQARLDRVPRELDVPVPPGWLKPEDLEALVAQAGSLFVYAATVLRFVADGRVGNPRTQLNIILGVRRQADGKPYALLDELYLQVLRSIGLTAQDADLLLRFQKVVGSLVLLRDPLPLVALERFVDVKSGDGHAVLRCLQSLIIFSEDVNDSPRIYHNSFPDFITDPSRCTDPNFLIMTGETEHRLALRCLHIMTSAQTRLTRDIIGVSDPSVFNEEIGDLAERVREGVSAELQYACRYWASHLSQAKHADETLVGLLEEFLSRCLLSWIELMSLMSCIPVAVTCVKEAHAHALSDPSLHHLAPLINDAHRFLLANLNGIKSSAPHVYHSALPFTPKHTTLYKIYAQEGKDSIRVLSGIPSKWSRCLTTLEGHSQEIHSVAFSPDGTRLASGSRDQTIRLWDAVSYTHIATLVGHEQAVNSVAFTPDSSLIASASDDCTIRLWDAVTGEHTLTLKGRLKEVICVAFSPDGSRLASGSDDGALRLWEVASGTMITSLEGSMATASIAFSPDSSRIASCGPGASIQLWDAVTGKEVMVLEGHSRVVRSLAFSPDSALLASGARDETVRVWDVRTGNQITTLAHPGQRRVFCVAFSPDGSFLAYSTANCIVRLWHVATATHTMVLEGHSAPVHSVAFSPDGSRVATGSSDVRIWDILPNVHAGRSVAPTQRLPVNELDDRSSGSAHGTRSQSAESQHSRAKDPFTMNESRSFTSVVFSPDGQRLACSSRRGVAVLCDGDSGAAIATVDGYVADEDGLAFSPDSSRLSVALPDGNVQVIDAVTGEEVSILRGHEDRVRSVVFSPDGKRIASGSNDLRLWDAETGMELSRLEGYSNFTMSLAFSPDGSRLLSDHGIGIRLWDAVSLVHVADIVPPGIKGNNLWLDRLPFSPDSSTIVGVLSERDKVRLWSAVTGAEVATFEGSPSRINSISFSANGEYIVSRSLTETYVAATADCFAENSTTSPPRFIDIMKPPGNRACSRLLRALRDDNVQVSLINDWIVLSRGQEETVRVCHLPADCSGMYMPGRLERRGHKVAVVCRGGQLLLLDLSRIAY